MSLETAKVASFCSGIFLPSFLRNRFVLLFLATSAIYFIYFAPPVSTNHIKRVNISLFIQVLLIDR